LYLNGFEVKCKGETICCICIYCRGHIKVPNKVWQSSWEKVGSDNVSYKEFWGGMAVEE
jgi:hypothetical protein